MGVERPEPTRATSLRPVVGGIRADIPHAIRRVLVRYHHLWLLRCRSVMVTSKSARRMFGKRDVERSGLLPYEKGLWMNASTVSTPIFRTQFIRSDPHSI